MILQWQRHAIGSIDCTESSWEWINGRGTHNVENGQGERCAAKTFQESTAINSERVGHSSSKSCVDFTIFPKKPGY
jgi:hypothetical protein